MDRGMGEKHRPKRSVSCVESSKVAVYSQDMTSYFIYMLPNDVQVEKVLVLQN